MTINFVEKYERFPGLWIVRVTNEEETETLFLEFRHEPTLAEARAKARVVIAAIIAAKAAADTDNADKKDILDYVYLYYQDPNNLTNNQKSTLLTRLCNRIVEKNIGL